MEQEEEGENAGISADWLSERYVYRRAMWRTISPATQCGSRSWAEIIRFECTLAAAVGNSVISGHPAYNGYHNGIKHNASINVNNNRAAPGVTGRVDGASSNVQGPFCTSAATTLERWPLYSLPIANHVRLVFHAIYRNFSAHGLTVSFFLRSLRAFRRSTRGVCEPTEEHTQTFRAFVSRAG